MHKKTRQSLRYCKHVTRTQARNFYYGLKLTPRAKRPALYAIYAFMRACDDLVDTPPPDSPQAPESLPESSGTTGDSDGTPEIIQGIARVESFRQQMVRAIEDPGSMLAEPARSVWPAFAHVANHYPINPNHLHAMLDGQRADLNTTRYRDFDELYDYCYNVAGTVGLVCVSIWGSSDKAANKLAEYRGIALQLTNILRDLREDYKRSRIYLPQEDLERFGLDPQVLAGEQGNDSFDRLMKFQIERARSYYEMSDKLEAYITPDCRKTSLAIMRVYRALLDEIAREPRRVLKGRVRLSKARKLRIMMGAYLAG